MTELKGRIANNSSNANVRTGSPNGDRQPGRIVSLGITPVNALFPCEGEEFNAALEGYVSDSALRLMPVKGIAQATREGGDINAPTLGSYGGTRPIGQNALSIAYMVEGGLCLYKELSKLNGREMRVFEMDADNYLFGTVVTKDAKDFFAGYKGFVYTTFTPTDGSELYKDEWEASMFVTKDGTNATTATYADGVIRLAPTGEYRVADAAVLAAGNISGLDGTEHYVSVSAE